MKSFLSQIKLRRQNVAGRRLKTRTHILTLMAESEEELKSLLIQESERGE